MGCCKLSLLKHKEMVSTGTVKPKKKKKKIRCFNKMITLWFSSGVLKVYFFIPAFRQVKNIFRGLSPSDSTLTNTGLLLEMSHVTLAK